MAAPPIALVVKAVDGTANAFDRINARIEAFSKRTQERIDRAAAPFRRLGGSIAQFSQVSGLNRVGAALGNIARRGQEAFARVGELVPLVGIIGSAASVAGVTRMVTAWSEWGQKISLTAQRMDMSAARLASMDAAAQLAGSSAGALTTGMQALGQTMYDAAGGRNTAAIVMFNTLGIAFRKNATEARSAAEVYPEVADKIAGMSNRYAQAQTAATLFGGAAEDLLPFLRRGAAGYRDYTATAARYLYFTDESAAAADRLRQSQVRVSLAVEGLRNRIAERLEPILTPMLSHFADWLATSPAVSHAVDWLGQKVDQLATYLDNTDWDAFGATVKGWGETIKSVTGLLGGPKAAIEELMLLLGASFALKVITPFLQLGTAIVATTAKLAALTKAQKEAGAGGVAGKLGTALLGGLAADQALRAVDPSDALGAWIDRNVPGASAIDNLASHLGLGRSYQEQSDVDRSLGYGSAPAAPHGNPNLAGRGVSGSAIHDTSRPSGRNAQGGAQKSAFRPATAQQWAADSAQLQQLGWSREQAAGILGNLDQESGGNQNAVGDSGSAYGLAQWHADRQADFEKTFGHRIQDSTHAEQIAFVDWELRHTEKGAGDRLSQASGVRDSAAAIRQYYERPANRSGMEDTWRGDRAERIAALTVPGAAGAPIQMAANDTGTGNDGRSTVRVEFGGQLPDGMKMRLDNPQRVDVGGPLVERPMLLGANA